MCIPTRIRGWRRRHSTPGRNQPRDRKPSGPGGNRRGQRVAYQSTVTFERVTETAQCGTAKVKRSAPGLEELLTFCGRGDSARNFAAAVSPTCRWRQNCFHQSQRTITADYIQRSRSCLGFRGSDQHSQRHAQKSGKQGHSVSLRVLEGTSDQTPQVTVDGALSPFLTLSGTFG